MRLIDADEIIDICNLLIKGGARSADGSHPVSIEVVLKVLETSPIIDAVPVVRCGDCKFKKDCTQRGFDDGFCSSGRREDETD